MTTWKWAAQRGGIHATAAVVLILLNFALPRLMPGDPLSAMMTAGSEAYVADAPQREYLRAFYGLDRPWTDHLVDHLTGLLRGDLGHSLVLHLPVSDLIVSRLPGTLVLVGCALFVGSLISGVLGATAGWHAGGRRDLLIVSGVALLRSVPVFFVAALLQHAFAVRLRWFPAFEAQTRFAAANWADVLHHLVLPTTALVAVFVAGQVLVMRAQVRAEKRQPFVRAARMRGISSGRVRWNVTRNAWRPVIAVIGVQAGVAISSTVLVESTFSYPGVGALLLAAISTRDYPLIQGCFLAHTVLVLFCGALADAARALLDPRMVAP